VVVEADGCVVDVEVDDDVDDDVDDEVGELVEVVELGTDEDDVLDEDVDELDDGGMYIVVEVVDEEVDEDVLDVEVEVLEDVLVELELVVGGRVVDDVELVGAGVPPNSKEPISPETPVGRGAPRWSYKFPANDAIGSGPASIAIELAINAIVFVGPPLSASA
jgi:hypothetical protein